MNLTALVVGVDPGPIPGIVVLRVASAGEHDASRPTRGDASSAAGSDAGLERPISLSIFQCDPGSAPRLVRETLSSAQPGDRRVLAVERFVIGPRAARSSTPKAGQITRDMVGALTALAAELPGVHVVTRSAAEVMPWATDARLDRAGLLEVTKGMPHARAAARHALYASVRDCGAPDPLSRKVRAP